MTGRVTRYRIDGAQGEGGGQVLRTALALSAIRAIPVEIHSIRARRRTPGLQPQHLTAVAALQRICDATVDGARSGAQRLTFSPQTLRSGEYRFDVGTAGSVGLVLQAILIPLAFVPGPSRVTLTGGTHVPWSPPVEYLVHVLLPTLAAMGIETSLSVERWGFYPRGGGQVVVTVGGAAVLSPITVIAKPDAVQVRGTSGIANLPGHIAERQRDRALGRLREAGLSARIEVQEGEAPGPGSYLFLEADRGGIRAGFSALGERGKPAEQVADEAVEALLEFLQGQYGCDPHLADQLIVPMALAAGTSRLTTSRVSRHLLTTLGIVQQILGCPVQVSGEEGQPGTVTIEGIRMGPVGGQALWTAGGDRPGGGGGAPREPRAGPPEFGADSRATTAEADAPCGGNGGVIGGPLGRLPGTEVRKARAADVPGMQRLISHFAARGELLPRTLNELYVHLRDFFVCVVGGEVVGICALSLYWEDLAEVRTLAVREEYGGKGMGAALVTACLDEAGRLGVQRVFALTYRPGFFTRLGFREIDKRELPQKIWKDCIKCAKFTNCDEVALIRDTPGLAAHAS
jgi:RNA 3'-terminal phosphate cyclase (ATP)